LLGQRGLAISQSSVFTPSGLGSSMHTDANQASMNDRSHRFAALPDALNG